MNRTDDAPFHEDEIPELARVQAWSFAFPVQDAEGWFRNAGLENVHVQRRRGTIEGAVLTIPMGQFFGRRRVSMTGIAGVATAPEARGTGAAVTLMTRVLREQQAAGVAISTLYPATLGLYRKLGYELAGARYACKAELPSITLRDRALPLRPMTDDDAPAVEDCYRARAARVNGMLDRGPYVWRRVRSPRGESARGFVVGEEGRVEGYVIAYEKRDPSLHFALHASDLVATTARAHRRLLTFAADHGTLGTSLHWSASPTDPTVHLLPRVGHEVKVVDTWMVRLLDVPRAMTERGWPPDARLAIDLDLSDEVLPDNAGRWTLRVEDGRATLTRGGNGVVRLDVRALASLYTSWVDPFALAAAGALDAPEGELEKLVAAFAGTSPWMTDMF